LAPPEPTAENEPVKRARASTTKGGRGARGARETRGGLAFAIVCLVGAPAAAAVIGSAASCTVPPETQFGNPNILARSALPGEGGVEAVVCGDAGSGQSFDGGCPSFETDIYPLFAPTGPWHCGDANCHGGTTKPDIDTSTAEKTLASLQAATVAAVPDKPYVVSDGGKDPNASAIMCNLQGACGTKMPEPPGKDPTDDQLCLVQAWLACGAK
jgi:hypothetical protein